MAKLEKAVKNHETEQRSKTDLAEGTVSAGSMIVSGSVEKIFLGIRAEVQDTDVEEAVYTLELDWDEALWIMNYLLSVKSGSESQEE